MTRMTLLVGSAAMITGLAAGALLAQPQSQGPQPFAVGNPLGLPMVPAPDGGFNAISSNVKVYGAIYSAESCSYDPERGVIVVPNRGVTQNVQTNDSWVSFVNHDGSVHTARWIGVRSGRSRLADAATRSQRALRQRHCEWCAVPGGSRWRDGPERPECGGRPSFQFEDRYARWRGSRRQVSMVQRYRGGGGRDHLRDADGRRRESRCLDLASLEDYARGRCLHLRSGSTAASAQWRGLNPQGNIVVANMGTDEILTFSKEGKLLTTERAAQTGSDGLVIMPDGTKYVSSVQNGGVSRIRPGQAAELIAQNIPSAASMCYDEGAKQLVVPMNPNNGLAFIPLK